MITTRNGRPLLTAPPAPDNPRNLWWQIYTGPCSVHVRNLEKLAAEVGGWGHLLRTVQRLPFDERAQQLAERRVVVSLGCAPDAVAVFNVVSWQPAAILLTLDFDFVAGALAGGNHAYL